MALLCFVHGHRLHFDWMGPLHNIQLLILFHGCWCIKQTNAIWYRARVFVVKLMGARNSACKIHNNSLTNRTQNPFRSFFSNHSYRFVFHCASAPLFTIPRCCYAQALSTLQTKPPVVIWCYDLMVDHRYLSTLIECVRHLHVRVSLSRYPLVMCSLLPMDLFIYSAILMRMRARYGSVSLSQRTLMQCVKS